MAAARHLRLCDAGMLHGGIKPAALNRVAEELRLVLEAQLGYDRAAVSLHRAHAERQFRRYLLIGSPGRDQLEYFLLTVRKIRRVSGTAQIVGGNTRT